MSPRDLRSDLAHFQAAALTAVDPARAVDRFLRRDGPRLSIDERLYSLTSAARVLLIAAGKAAMPMAASAARRLGERLSAGIVVTKYHHAAGYALPAALRVIEAGHPIPDAAGLAGAQAILSLLATTTADDLVLLLLSGGASALTPCPAGDLALADLQTLTDLLLRAGAPIGELNTLRKHLSRLAGGQLVRQAAPARLAALILSDVVGDPLTVIASGMTAPDPTTYADAADVLRRYALWEQTPPAIRRHLELGRAGQIAETPKPGDPVFADVYNVLIGSNRSAALAAVAAARARGYNALLLSTLIEGEAREVAKVGAALAKSIRLYGEPLAPPACLVWGGETTVTVRGAGQGGRNQELALAAALALEGVPGVALLALATDGTDGPTDAAGAIVDGQTAARARQAGWDAPRALAENNAYPCLEAAGTLLRTGPTGTNVNDLGIILVDDGREACPVGPSHKNLQPV